MIKSLRLKNFRSHTDNLFEFGGVVSIEGLNDAGKTSVYRALERTLLGSSFSKRDIQRGEKSCTLELVHEDGRKVTRTYTNSKTTTILTTPDGKSETYTTAKGLDSVIQEFNGVKQTAVPLQMVSVRENPYFLLNGEQSSTILKQVNSLSYTSSIEAAMQSLNSEINSLNRTSRPSVIKRLEELPSLERMEQFREDANEIAGALAEIEKQQAELAETKEHIETCRGEIATYRRLKAKDFDKVAEKIEALETLNKALQRRKDRLVADKQIAAEFRKDLDEYRKAQLAVSETELKIARQLNEQLQKESVVCPNCGVKL